MSSAIYRTQEHMKLNMSIQSLFLRSPPLILQPFYIKMLKVVGALVFFFFLVFWSFRPHPWHVEVPKLGVELEL